MGVVEVEWKGGYEVEKALVLEKTYRGGGGSQFLFQLL